MSKEEGNLEDAVKRKDISDHVFGGKKKGKRWKSGLRNYFKPKERKDRCRCN